MQHHGISTFAYLSVFGALLLLTALTVVVAGTPIGNWHTPVGLSISVVKALLVALIFMHVIASSRLTYLVIIGSIVMLAILLGLTMADYWSRPWRG